MTALPAPKIGTRPLRILNLGAGVQSTTLALMSCRGLLPKVDCAIFADTRYEPPAVYTHLEWLKGELAAAGIPFHQVTEGDLRADAIAFRRQRYNENPTTGRKGYASIPLFVLNPDGSQGLIRRQCTSEYKIAPIERFIRTELLGLKPRQRYPREIVVEQWFGITWDEFQRVRTSPEPWKVNVYPFCAIPEPMDARWIRPDGRPRVWDRTDCIKWLAQNYPGRTFPRSACICCPYRSNAEWRQMRDNDPASWADAVRFDAEIREAEAQAQLALVSFTGTPFIHRQMVPLGEARIDEDTDQTEFNFPGVNGAMGAECAGMCGV